MSWRPITVAIEESPHRFMYFVPTKENQHNYQHDQPMKYVVFHDVLAFTTTSILA